MAVVLRQVGVRQVLVSEPAAERRELLTALGLAHRLSHYIISRRCLLR